MNKAKQLALGTLLGLPPGHSIMKDLVNDPDVVALAEVAEITKEDFFGAENNGRSFFDYSEIWEKMDEAVAKLREKGADIRGSDFAKIVSGSKTPLNFAFDQDNLNKFFTPVIWKGQLEAMQDAWYSLESWTPKKNKCDFIRIQLEEVAVNDGRTFREAQLKRMGIEYSDIRSAVNSGNYDNVRKKMTQHGEHLRKEDVFILDKSGDHTLDSNSGWKHFSELVDELAKNGERLEVEDFQFHRAKRDSILKDAQECDGLQELFKPRLWYGRATDVIKIYNQLTDVSRAKVQIDGVLDELANHDYGSKFDCDQITDRADLTRPVNEEDSAKADFHPIRPLALKTVWNKIACVQGALKNHGQSITLDDLRLTSGLRNESCLVHAARYGSFDKIMDIVRETGGKLTVAELTTKDKDGKSIIDYLVKNNQLTHLLQPRDWLGRGQDLAQLWPAIPEHARDKINFQELIGGLNTLALRDRFANRMPSPGMP